METSHTSNHVLDFSPICCQLAGNKLKQKAVGNLTT